MLTKLLPVLLAGALAGGGIGTGLAVTGAFDGDDDSGEAEAAVRSFVDVYSCPSAEGSIGRVARGDRVLLTAVGPDGEFYEINYPLSPNGRAWIDAGQVEPDEPVDDLPESNCRTLFAGERAPGESVEDVGEATPTPTGTIEADALPTSEAPDGDQDEDSDVPESPPDDGAEPTEVPPTAEPTEPPDTTGLTITQGSVGPAQINEEQSQACVQRPTTVQVSAIVSDESGVAKVQVSYTLADTSGFTDKSMTSSGGQYTATVGPFAVTTGTTVTFTVIATDQAGNESSATIGSTFVNECSFN